MVSTPVKVLLFLGGGAVAAGATAYISGALDPWLNGKPAAVAELPASADPTPDPAAPKDERLPEPAAAAVVPSFDVVRVEPDGSMVIAGKAALEALVEALSADATIGKTQSGGDGDFAIVLDQPLKPGDYEIKLRSTDKAGTVAMSVETAIVSVPETPGGQVLAMIEAPGQASEIITAPEPEKPADVAAAEPTPAAPAEEKPADVAAADPAKPAEEKPADVAAAPEPAAPAEEKPADVAAADPAKPAEEKPADVAADPEPAKPAEEKPAEIAAADPAKPAEPAPAPAAVASAVSVEAVEIDGKKVFVAGAADPNRTVRVYANEIHLGDAKSSPEGRFLVEAEQDLPVGNYIIRADLLGDDGSQVLARAAVPFEREPGEAIAAIAPEQPVAPAEEKPADVAAAPEPAAPEKPADVAAAPEPAAPAEEKPADVTAAPEPAAPAEEKPADVVAAPEPAAPAEEKPADVAAAPAPAAPAEEKPAEVAAAEPEVTAPPLQPVKRAVIIRRGDSLWRISRRAYGHGIRYSTLYLANTDQIRDPDKIWPGQVFSMPDKTQEGEEANWQALGDQVTTQSN
ncbi:MAG TPA: LysM peptidoglycan-binding domain-containing protein [Rhizobiaceae bacterium]|nr:LysM peptidoglycan-binding domain-containing protein [Rhizobiaceae bacterium]